MKKVNCNNIIVSWNAPIIPSNSIVGIPLGLEHEYLKSIIDRYIINKKDGLYKFDGSPVLRLDSFILDNQGDGFYHFLVNDPKLTNRENLNELQDSFYSRALHIGIRFNRVFFIKVWAFEVFENEIESKYSYQGKTFEDLGLYSKVVDFSQYSKLEFDSAEEWFYTDQNYGRVEITGYGQSLEDFPEQEVMAIAVIQESAYDNLN